MKKYEGKFQGKRARDFKISYFMILTVSRDQIHPTNQY